MDEEIAQSRGRDRTSCAVHLNTQCVNGTWVLQMERGTWEFRNKTFSAGISCACSFREFGRKGRRAEATGRCGYDIFQRIARRGRILFSFWLSRTVKNSESSNRSRSFSRFDLNENVRWLVHGRNFRVKRFHVHRRWAFKDGSTYPGQKYFSRYKTLCIKLRYCRSINYRDRRIEYFNVLIYRVVDISESINNELKLFVHKTFSSFSIFRSIH